MASDFGSARLWAQRLMADALYDGALAVDATMGNGYDTLWLCQQVGAQGRVWAFDVQPDALSSTRNRLEGAGLLSRAELILQSHDRMADYVPQPVDGVMFNLGWLPGSDRVTRTHRDTTIAAAEAALTLLKPKGLLTLCAYPGHDEGREELDALRNWVKGLPPKRFDALTEAYCNQPGDPPVLFAVRKRP